jgi:hypothetical protein
VNGERSWKIKRKIKEIEQVTDQGEQTQWCSQQELKIYCWRPTVRNFNPLFI